VSGWPVRIRRESAMMPFFATIALVSPVLRFCPPCDNEAQMNGTSVAVMVLCFAAGYVVKARLAARERRRRKFRPR
jgi:hypothetical protein